MANRWGNSVRLYFSGFQNHWRWWWQPWNKKTWKKSYDQHRQHSKKQRHYFANKGPLVKNMVFPVVMHGCDGWTINKAECWRTYVFELWFWRRLLRVPWPARRSSRSILKEIGPGCSLEGLMLKLKLQYFGHLMWRADSFEKTLMLGKIEGEKRRGWQRMRWQRMVGWHHWLKGHEFEPTLGVGDGQGGLACCSSMGSQRVRHNWAIELNWTNNYNDSSIPLNILKLRFLWSHKIE